MHTTRLAIAVVLLLTAASPALAAPLLRPYGPAELLATLDDPAITEASGLAASRLDDGIVWTHNDSGGPADVYAVDTGTGDTVVTVSLEGIEQIDWEDLAAGPGPDGKPWLFVADIGDNPSIRPFVHVIAFPEPDLDGVQPGAVLTRSPDQVEVYAFVYEDGPRDAETLLVDPLTGALTIVTKTLPRTGTGRLPIDPENGFSGVYTASDPLLPVNVLIRQADLDLRKIVTVPGDAALWATAGDIAPDGSRVVIRTLFEAFEFALVDGDVAAAVQTTPLNVSLPEVRQGESIAYTADSTSLLAGSEGTDSPLHRLRPAEDEEFGTVGW